MGLVKAGPDAVVFEGELAEDGCEALGDALDALRGSDASPPGVDLSRTTYVCSKAIGLLVALAIDLIEQGRWFDLQASDRVWDVLAKAGVTGVFFKRPDTATPDGAAQGRVTG